MKHSASQTELNPYSPPTPADQIFDAKLAVQDTAGQEKSIADPLTSVLLLMYLVILGLIGYVFYCC